MVCSIAVAAAADASCCRTNVVPRHASAHASGEEGCASALGRCFEVCHRAVSIVMPIGFRSMFAAGAVRAGRCAEVSVQEGCYIVQDFSRNIV